MPCSCRYWMASVIWRVIRLASASVKLPCGWAPLVAEAKQLNMTTNGVNNSVEKLAAFDKIQNKI